MGLWYVSFLAGVLSVLAPCVASLLPALVARSGTGKRAHSPVYIVAGLSVSVFVFSVLLKSTTAFLGIPQQFWQLLSGTIIVLFGFVTLFPFIWEKVVLALRLDQAGYKASSAALQQRGAWGDALLGASLGPIFSACSPTYGVIVAIILPTEPVRGLMYLTVFILGLAAMLLLLLVGGSALVRKLGWSMNPRGWFRRVVGLLFIAVGISIIGGFDKDILTFAVERGWFDWQLNMEHRLGL